MRKNEKKNCVFFINSSNCMTFSDIEWVKITESTPLPEREVSTHSGSYVVDLLDLNKKKLPE